MFDVCKVYNVVCVSEVFNFFLFDAINPVKSGHRWRTSGNMVISEKSVGLLTLPSESL